MLGFEEGNAFCRCVWVNGPVIVGAGPSGLAVASGLKDHGVPYVILERSNCIASLWQNKTYDRLKLHLPKKFCELPGIPFPSDYPEYPSKRQFIEYLENYAKHFDINPRFNECVESAKFDEECNLWRVKTVSLDGSVAEYICQQLVVATGENADPVVPEIEGLTEFDGEVIHACDYRNGERYRGKKVLVVGCGNSGMELSLDLCIHDAKPAMVVRSSVHVLPREIFGKSTFETAMLFLRWLPLWLVDKILLALTWIILGNLEKYGLKRSPIGPLELKNTQGKTPVLDIGALQRIKSGEIQIVTGIKTLSPGTAEFINGDKIKIDSIILATGYRCNVPKWLQSEDFFTENGFPKSPFQNGWKGKDGLYAAGFTRRGIAGASADAVKISEDIFRIWKNDMKQQKGRRQISTL